jgi:hypothetical protein
MTRVRLAQSNSRQRVDISILHLGERLRSKTLEQGIWQLGERVHLHSGFDARTNLVPENWNRRRLSKFTYGRELIPGEVAATFGHTQIIRSYVQSNADWVLIIEDNIKFFGLTEIVEFLKNMYSDSPLLINFLSEPAYNDVKKWEKYGQYSLGRTKSVPTLAKCYAINIMGIKSLNTGIQKNGFAGFQADFPAFFDNYIDFMVVRDSKLKIESSTSHIGPRDSLVIHGWIAQIYNAIRFLISTKNGNLRSRLQLILVSIKMKVRRKIALKKNSIQVTF